MRLRPQLLLFLLFVCQSVPAQDSKLDSIENSISYLSPSAKAKFFVSLTGKKLKTKSGDAIEFAQRSVSLASKTESWRLLSIAQQNLGEAYILANDIESAIHAFERQKQVLQGHNDTLGIANAQLKLGLIFLENRDKDVCLRAANDALLAFQSVKDTNGIAASYQLMAEVALASNDHQLANTYLATAFSYLRQKIQDESDQIKSLETQNVNHKRIRGLLFVLIGIGGFMAAMLSIFYRKKQVDNVKLAKQIKENLRQRAEIEELGKEQEMKNISLDLLNKKLVDEIAEREHMQRFSVAKDKYLATITHEMRSPLNDIAGLAHLLLENNPRPDQIDQMRALQFCANELTALTNEALGYSNIDDGKGGYNAIRDFVIQESVLHVFERAANKADKKGVLFHHSIDEAIPKRVIGNETRLVHVLSNLLNNCLETTATGLINLSMFLAEKTAKEVVLKFIIEAPDKGTLNKLYHQKSLPGELVGQNSRSAEDRMLSLAMTKRMVEMQGGKMMVENLMDEATRFQFIIPFKVSDQFNDVQAAAEPTYEDMKGANILLVEDNKINQFVVAKMLRKHGVNVSTAENGIEALEQLGNLECDLVLMDIQMPEMDGYRATAEIRKHPSAAIKSLPIIALTSSAYVNEKEKAMLFGMNDHIGKPFSPNELLDKINANLELSRKLG